MLLQRQPQINWDNPQARGLVGCWLWAPSRGTSRVKNLIPWGNDGIIATSSNTQEWRADPSGVWGAGGYFSAIAGNSPRIARYPAIEPTNNFTVDLWLHVGVLLLTSNYRLIVSKEFNAHSSPQWVSWALYRYSSRQISFFNSTTSVNNNILTSVVAPLQDGALVHIVGRFTTGGTNNKQLFVNGARNAQTTVAGSPIYDTDSGGDITVGRSLAGTDELGGATVLSLRIWDYAVADEIIRSLWDPRSRFDMFSERRASISLYVPSGGPAFSISLSDGISLTDSPANAAGFERSWADAIALTESFARVVDASRSYADGLSLTDSASRASTFANQFAEALVLSESQERSLSIARSLADALALSEAIDATLDAPVVLTLALSDALQLDDSSTLAAAFSRAYTDQLALSDQVGRAAEYARSVTEALGLQEAVGRAMAIARAVADDITLTESIDHALVQLIVLQLADAIELSDTASGVRAFARSLADALTLSDSSSATGAYARTLAEQFTLTDDFSRTASILRTIIDQLVLVDDAGRASVFVLGVNDLLFLTDTASGVLSDGVIQYLVALGLGMTSDPQLPQMTSNPILEDL